MQVRSRGVARSRGINLFGPSLARQAAWVALRGLDPRALIVNPVMLVIEAAAVLTTILLVRSLLVRDPSLAAFTGQVGAWLWLTVFLASFAEAMAEARGRARAGRLRALEDEVPAKLLVLAHDPNMAWAYEVVSSHALRAGEIVLVEAGDTIPADGEVIDGVAEVDESAITGESAPVIRESGGDRSAVTGGTRVVSDWLKVRVTSKPGDSFHDHVIRLVETARRQTTWRRVALTAPLMGLAALVVVAMAAIHPFQPPPAAPDFAALLTALLAALMPTTTAGILSAVGIAGMSRLVEANVIAKSGSAVEAAGQVGTVLLDKTGTITLGGRMAEEFVPLPGTTERDLAEAALLASLSDDTPEGRSIVELAEQKYGLVADRERIRSFVPFSAETRMSAAGMRDGGEASKGAIDAILAHVGTAETADLQRIVDRIARSGGTPLVVSRDRKILGVVHLKDTVRPSLRAQFAQLRAMGIRTIMVTGDNPLTAATIAAEAGVDDFVAEVSPEAKLKLIRDEQAKGRLVAMCGDGTNDAPALAQADVGVALNLGTAAAREAGNMIDLDSDPLKLMAVIRAGKHLLTTRRALTTFSIVNDVAKYFAILPALFMAAYPEPAALNIMDLASPESAILSAAIFNALIIIALIPLALRGVRYAPGTAATLLRRNLLVYGLGGLIVPFIGIKALDLAITGLGLV
jgi:potassium-transporting ATPase ATP-binding subunit